MPSFESRLDEALGGDAAAVRELVAAFTPVIQARAVNALVRRGGKMGRDPRQELGDLVQDVLLLLFRDDGRVLRGWNAEKGLGLLGYVGLVATREIGQIVRSGRRSPWALEPWADDALEDAAGGGGDAEAAAGSRDMFDRLYERLAKELAPNALDLFRMLVVESLPIAEVCAQTGLSVDALYSWRSRLLKRARQLLAQMNDTPRPGFTRSPPMQREEGT